MLRNTVFISEYKIEFSSFFLGAGIP